MNYTLIAYREDSSYYDRCGDFVSCPGEFETFFSTDREQFAERYAEIQFNKSWDTLAVLINGVPEDHWSDDEHAENDAIEDLKNAALVRIKHEAERKKEEDQRLANEKAERDRLAAIEKQRASDLAAYEQLKKKLGM